MTATTAVACAPTWNSREEVMAAYPVARAGRQQG